MPWLVKEEPSHYNFDRFLSDGETVWSGVRNPVAQRNLRSMQQGDRVFVYHTGDEKAIVGTATVVATASPDQDDPSGKLSVVRLRADKKLAQPVTLKTIKAEARFAESPLVRVPRLSVVAISEEQWRWVEAQSAA